MRKYLFKVTVLFITFVFIGVLPATSQYFRGGIMAGFTGSQMDGDTYNGFNKLGFSGGVFGSRNFNDMWSMQLELKFIMKGASKPVTNIDPSIYKMNLIYYELPILATYQASKKVKLESGLAVAYLSKAVWTYNDVTQTVTSQFNKTDISWIAGVYYIMNDKFSVNLKFSYSLKRVSYFVGNLTVWGTYGQYNNVLNLSLYYNIK